MTIKTLKKFISGLKDTDQFQHHEMYHDTLFCGWVIVRKGKIIKRKTSKTFDL